MSNIKTLEVVSALPGLEVGDTLTRADSNSNFELNVETITEDYTAKRNIEVSPSLINKDEFKAIEWFTPYKSNKQIIADLKERVEELKAANDLTNELYYTSLKNRTALSYENDYLSRIKNRIDAKLEEFENKEKCILNMFYEGGNIFSAETTEELDQAQLVYSNMIDLLKKLKA